MLQLNNGQALGLKKLWSAVASNQMTRDGCEVPVARASKSYLLAPVVAL